MANQTDVKKAMTQAAQNGTDTAKKMVEESTVQARAAVEKTMETANKTAADLMKAAEEAAEFSRGNLEAFTKASQLYVTGVQDLSRQTMAMFQAFSEQAIEGVKAMSAMKSMKDAADFQASFTKTAFERAVSDTTKISEAAMKLAETSIEPISARMTLAMEKIAKPLAA